MALDTATVARIAHLARIRVPEEDLPGFARELDSILAWVEQLNAVETADVPPMTGVADMALRRRVDDVTDGAIQDKVLANAPEAMGGFYTVPKVVE